MNANFTLSLYFELYICTFKEKNIMCSMNKNIVYVPILIFCLYIERIFKNRYVFKQFSLLFFQTLYRSVYTGQEGSVEQLTQPIHGFVDDYAFLIKGLLGRRFMYILFWIMHSIA